MTIYGEEYGRPILLLKDWGKKVMGKQISPEKLAISFVFWARAINGHCRVGTSQMSSELIFMFLESGEQGEWAQIGCQFKIIFFIFLPPPNRHIRHLTLFTRH